MRSLSRREAHSQECSFREVDQKQLFYLFRSFNVCWAVRVQQRFEVGPVEGGETVRNLPLHVHVLCLFWCQVSCQLALQSSYLCMCLPLIVRC